MTENNPDIRPFEAFSRVVGDIGQQTEDSPGLSSIQGWLDSGMVADFAQRPAELQKVAFATACMAHNRAMALATQMLYPHSPSDAQAYIDYIMGEKPIPQQFMAEHESEDT